MVKMKVRENIIIMTFQYLINVYYFYYSPRLFQKRTRQSCRSSWPKQVPKMQRFLVMKRRRSDPSRVSFCALDSIRVFLSALFSFF